VIAFRAAQLAPCRAARVRAQPADAPATRAALLVL